MTKPNNLPLYLALYKLQKYFYNLIHHFRKEYKYTLGRSILDLAWETIDRIIEANTLPNNKKFSKLKNASGSFDKLKTRLRMAHELELISHRKYNFIIKQNQEIGRMLSGWLKWAEKKKKETQVGP
jgi:four helix bundle protein